MGCWTKPIPAPVAVARPVPIATARVAHVPAAQKAAITAPVPAANNSTKMEEKKEEITLLYQIILQQILFFFEKIQPIEPYTILHMYLFLKKNPTSIIILHLKDFRNFGVATPKGRKSLFRPAYLWTRVTNYQVS